MFQLNEWSIGNGVRGVLRKSGMVDVVWRMGWGKDEEEVGGWGEGLRGCIGEECGYG